jgi:hypothetical protein
MLTNEFFLAFGNLLYSIAMSDSEVQLEEVEQFHQITRNELKTLSENPDDDVNYFNSLLADSGFLNSYHAELTAEIALDKFIDYYQKNTELFKPWIKEFCMNSVLKVAEAFDGIVTEEKQIILKLEELFNR